MEICCAIKISVYGNRFVGMENDEIAVSKSPPSRLFA
jgi:hypothetical protein